YKAISGTFSQDLVKSLRSNPDIEYVEQEQVFTMAAVQTNSPNWGLARVSQRQRNPNAPYNFPDSAGQGVDVYVIDTGINTRHSDFGGRASLPVSFINGEPAEDLNGHGTHVAGIVGGNTYGVAKKVRLIGVKVLGRDGRGSTSGIIAGVNWVARQARSTGRRSVINMSLGGGNSNALNAAVDAAVQAGIPVIVAAGNEAQDACNVSPANSRSAFTVGATDYYDNLANYSNWGRCVNIQAPGSNILSTYIGSPSARSSLSGTSMASPHVAGIAALHLGQGSANSPQTVYNMLTSRATRNVVRGLRGNSPNLMVYS
ncbi:subtilisin-like protein, partial [Basidiobolus meristosporus CBS 931.73]